MIMNKLPNYTEAFEELQEIVSEIEGGDISVDQLSDKVKRAALLIKICKDKLTATEGDVNQILKELESNDSKNEQ
jgi:exodeoxyribonuclease VII small subunit